MRAQTTSFTLIGAVVFSLAVWAGQAPSPPPAPVAPPGPAAPFYPHVVASGLRGGYQVVAADLNQDGRVDLIVNAHALVLVDSDGDGDHEIVSGGTRGPEGTPRGTKPGVFFYKATDSSAQQWERMVLDAEIAANACVAADLNGDTRMDVACIDNGSPWTLRWYENVRPSPGPAK